MRAGTINEIIFFRLGAATGVSHRMQAAHYAYRPRRRAAPFTHDASPRPPPASIHSAGVLNRLDGVNICFAQPHEVSLRRAGAEAQKLLPETAVHELLAELAHRQA